MNIKFYLQSVIVVVLLILFNLNMPPFGITIGTSILIPLCLDYLGNKLNIKENRVFICVLLFYLIARTIDWFFAPGTHDIQSVSLFYVLSLISSVAILFLFLRNGLFLTLQNLLLIVLICLLPFLQILILESFFNAHLDTTNRTLFDILLA